MNCSKCGGPLGHIAYSEDIAIWRCQSCCGMLLETGTLEKIRKAVRADEFFDVGHPKVGKALDTVAAISCPLCKAPMRSGHDPAQPHIQLDTCSGCGAVFLDAGELIDLSHQSLFERLYAMVRGAVDRD